MVILSVTRNASMEFRVKSRQFSATSVARSVRRLNRDTVFQWEWPLFYHQL